MFQLQAEDEHKPVGIPGPQMGSPGAYTPEYDKKGSRLRNNRSMGTGRGVWGDRRCGQISDEIARCAGGGFGEVGKPNGYYIFFRARRSTRHNSLYISSLVRL
jgi:hypothetical protein